MRLGIRARRHSQRVFAFWMRLLSVVQLLTGLGFIGFSCYLHTPPEDSLTLGLVVTGALAVATSVFGFVVACRGGCCLSTYMTLGTLVTLAQAGFALYLFIAPQDAVDALVASKGGEGNEQKLHDAVYTGRWVFLVAMVVQLLAMVVAVVLRSVSPSEEEYRDFEQEEYEDKRTKTQRQIDLLKEKIQGLDARLDSRKRSPPKNAVMLTSAGAPTLPEQRRSLFRSDTEDIKLEESDVEAGIGTIPAVLPETPPSTAGAWGLPAAQQQEQQQPHQQRSFKPSWNKAGSKNSLE